jgi:hypothetical protein
MRNHRRHVYLSVCVREKQNQSLTIHIPNAWLPRFETILPLASNQVINQPKIKCTPPPHHMSGFGFGVVKNAHSLYSLNPVHLI